MSSGKPKIRSQRKSKPKKTEIKSQPIGSYTIGRIVVLGKAKFDPEEGESLLFNTINNHWPAGSEVEILITPGGFLCEKLKCKWGKINKKWKSDSTDINDFVEASTNNVYKMLTNRLYKAAKGKIDYISIGSDIWYYDGFKAEIVVLVDINEKEIISWTGKSYPTGNEERKVVQVTNLKSYFQKIGKKQVMILGCHDLTMFNPRAIANQKVGSDRSKRCSDMTELTLDKKPKVVIQHPHTTDTSKTWRNGWIGLNRTCDSIRHWASGICYYNHGDYCRESLDAVLQKTKSSDRDVLDIELKGK